ncbi:TetR/AcrR family transcriptional regulator [Lichenifustis flavocetrariae]|uniref:TetR/AcrR family transcriptional regulator n=1 Tax=Lichenifustis flavocetrariae TaxID=2949735 RepID=A0AA41Z589_9HYPH|nr:TetR/AcrR family transcriptional regulator [Lichenifustis flavocetrariae]MCW6513198.1 TetR/AcrR family transcriptional regulator [Lichenifustis flavocetrariae]
MELAEKEAVPRRKTGRPLSFDRDAALEQAMLTFWRYGYETTSIVDLTTAMGVTAPSLYTAFGDKKRLFLEAARRYAGDPEAMAQALDDAETACDAARAMLTSAATAFTGEATPRGCLLASATASGSSASADVQQAITDIRGGVAIRLRARITRDVEAGILPLDLDVAALAGMVMAIIQGMSVMARDGMDRPELLAIVERTLQAWPVCRT